MREINGRGLMPRVDDDIQNCVIYLYRTVEEARMGRRAGGSGFVIAVDSAVKQQQRLLYTIANSRTIKNGFHVIRADNINQEIPPFEKGAKDWVHHPAGEDVAACLLGLASDYPRISSYPFERFLTRESLDQLGVGVGSDVFLMGRQFTGMNTQCTTPVARFGKLAMADRHSTGRPAGQSRDSFLAAVFEPNGHTGAPVFVLSDHESDREPSHGGGSMATPWLLGVDLGHIGRYRPVINAQGQRHPRGWKVPEPNGLIVVTPAWKLRALLETERTLEGGSHDAGGGWEFTAAEYLNALKLASRKLGTDVPATEEQSDAGTLRTHAEKKQSYSLEDLRRDFPDEDACLRWLVNYSNPNGIYCRTCQDTTPHAKIAGRRSYSCARCGHHVHPTVGTIYHYSRKPLHRWFEAIYLITSTPARTTATQLRVELKVNYKTAWRMRKEIRKMFSRNGA